MISVGKWRFGRWYEGAGQYSRIPDSLGVMRRLMTETGLDNVFRLTDVEVLRLIANRLTAGELCLFEIARMTLKELWNAVEATPIGKQFLDQFKDPMRPQPSIRWGKVDYRSQYDSEKNEIVLHQHFKKDDGNELSDNEWKQAIATELGNAVKR